MASHQKEFSELIELVEKLNKDRAWILEQLDKGRWPEFRPDLAALERELGQLLTRATEYIEENCFWCEAMRLSPENPSAPDFSQNHTYE